MNQIEPKTYAPEIQEHVVAAVPRVNIAIFCTTQATAATMQKIVIDRRMARAHVDIHQGGIMQAVQSYSQSSTPDVLVLETEGYRDQVLSELSQLAKSCSHPANLPRQLASARAHNGTYGRIPRHHIVLIMEWSGRVVCLWSG